MPDKEQINREKEEFIALLRQSEREDEQDVDYLLEDLEEWGFFKAPASRSKHNCFEGGLVHHSLNVCKMALLIREQVLAERPDLEPLLPRSSVIVASLLHDVCKSNIYQRVVRKQKNEVGIWESYETYNIDYTALPLGHGEKSVIMLLRSGFELTEDEILAIRWHMAAWDLSLHSQEMVGSLNKASEKSPLVSLIQAADQMAANLMERKMM